MPAGTAAAIQRPQARPAAPARPADFTADDVLDAHRGGKLSISLRAPLVDRRDLSMLYTPGVAGVSSLIATDPAAAREYTWASRVVAVISDGTAVLGLGDIGPKASLPVMEGKSALMKSFAGLDSVPIVLSTTDPDEIVAAVTAIAPSFGAINLEDISAPRCFEVEQRLVEALDIPVMHDDQHGTAVVVLAALMNASSVIQRVMVDLRVVIAGAGAAGIACAKILLAAGIRDLIIVDSKGVLSVGRDGMHPVKAEMAASSNPRGVTGGLADAMVGADVFIGVSGGSVDPALVETMGAQPIVFALANPTPEIDPAEADRARRGGGGHRSQRLREPDQQRAGLPRDLPRRAGLRRPADHRGHEGGRVRRDLRRGAGPGDRRPDRAGPVHPRAGPDGRRRRHRRRQGRGRRGVSRHPARTPCRARPGGRPTGAAAGRGRHRGRSGVGPR